MSDTPARRSAYAYATPARTRPKDFTSGAGTPTRREQRAFEIGDMVKLDGTGLTGVLRYMGPVHGREGHFAGLELTGSSYGHGKNDGTIDGWQYFATTPNNGVFGPVSKLIPLSTARPTSATARPLSALAGRSSRTDMSKADATPRRPRTSAVPVPSSVPRTAPRKSMGARTTRTALGSSAQAAPSPRRPLSSAATMHRPATRQDDGFVFDDDPAEKASPQDARQTLLEQLALPTTKDAIADIKADHAVPMAEYERLCDELADMRRKHSLWDEERAELILHAQQRENELEATKRLEWEDEVRQRHILETRVRELERQLHEALDTATVAADAHDALERKINDHVERIVDLETALAAAQLRAEHVAPESSESDAQRELSLLHAKVETMMAGWNRERVDLTDKIAELQRAGNELVHVLEQLALARDENEQLRQRVQALEATAPGDDTATGIDRAALQEQTAHLQAKVEALEEEVHEARTAADAARAEHDKVRASMDEAVKEGHAKATQLQKALHEAETRTSKVELALKECHASWERDRAELEQLREIPATPTLQTDTSDRTIDSGVVQALEARISQLEREKDEQHTQFTKDIAELESLVESRIFREDELETELEQLRAQTASS
ncbi:CAP-Gly domain-containing linker protein 1 [Malassezia restricta CBS 7877]|uniref:CAP-Gly domain-containing linker protein 1 n=1 Tax=Malassezia restricta (strain ATCC 96810 / NBRC 103918 / CBS 7877) TaxID=425264 RepID=A0A3G2RZ75_MALR7|nr:CAP-Gly domain-containing linker protein 1 [Malassezia restricta CBS 7877]